MVSCATTGCWRHDRNQKELCIKFHRFPKNNEIRLKWVKDCKQDDLLPADVVRVCSEYSDETDCLRDLKNELFIIPVKLKLKPEAVPYLNLIANIRVLNHIKYNDERILRSEMFVRK